MKFFKASGLWFPADEPENRVAGTLRFSQSGLQLKLLGGFRGGWSPDIQAYGIIQGVVGDSPYGEFVSLYDCFQTSKSLRSQGIGSETIQCGRAYVGDDYLFEEEADIRLIRFKTSFLYDWARTKDLDELMFSLPPWNELGIQKTFPEPARFDIDDAVLLVEVGYSFRRVSRAAGITATSSIGITPGMPLKARAIAGKFVRRFCDLLSFATDRTNAVEEVTLTRTQDTGLSEGHHLLHDRIFQLKNQHSGLNKGDMLFSLSEAIEARLNIFQRWLDFTNENAGFCTVYFASLYAEPTYLDEKFQRLISAFTLLCGSLLEESPQAIQFVEDISRVFNKSFTDKDRPHLYHLLPTPPRVEMTLHLGRLLEEHARLMGQVVADFDEFVIAVSTTLRYIETREKPEGQRKLEGADLFYAMQKIRVLIKILVLGRLGFDGSKVASFIERNMDFLHLKALSGKSY